MKRLHSYLFLLLVWSVSVPATAGDEINPLRTETLISNSSPYINEMVILTVRVHHDNGVRKIHVEPIHSENFSLERLAEPPETTRMIGRGKIITDFIYALTPVSPGWTAIPAISVEVESAPPGRNGNQGVRTTPEILRVHTEPDHLEIRPASIDGGSWLPLHDLRVTVQYDPRQPIRVGQPFELSIVQTALGSSGDRLPELSALLQDPDFRIYPGQTRTSRRPGPKGQVLLGQRIETLTLVPLRAGSLTVGPITIPWWDVGRDRPAQAEWQGLALEVGTPPGSASPASAPVQDTSTVILPVILSSLLTGMLCFSAGWWLRGQQGDQDASATTGGRYRSGLRARLHRIRTRLFPERGTEKLRRIAGSLHHRQIRERLGKRYRKSRPLAGIERWVSWLATHLPVPRMAWLETLRLNKRLQTARNAHEFERDLQTYARQLLHLPPQTTMTDLAHALEVAYPQADTARIHTLLRQLDASLYGGDDSLEPGVWKHDFNHELRRFGYRNPPRPRKNRNPGLPALNPVYSS